ncbi:ABC transporter substrate-binding protein [Clostridium sp. BJN0001]|uniref:ABC transporter substrate-binding protein n=1 Tax=Clostridium sp. BJN0001 TaxID=2930219 RepID=UPI001FD08E1F|nr:ABC transporter substrate-binding protein [Clostridium sp. BJN0001]
MKKRTSIILCTIITLISVLIAGCGGGNDVKSDSANKVSEQKTVKIIVPDGLPALSLAKMIKEKPQIVENYSEDYSIEKSAQNVATSVMKCDADIAIVPSNLAATAYNKTEGKYVIAATTGWGSFYIGSTNKDASLDSLKGNKVYNIGKGLTPDIITRVILNEKGIDADSIDFNYVDGVNEMVPVIVSGKTDYAVIPEPALTIVKTKKPDFNTFINLNEEWKKLFNSEYGYPQATVIINSDFLKENKEYVEKFLQEVKKSCEYLNSNSEDVASYSEEIGISAKKEIIPQAIKNGNVKYVSIGDTKNEYKNYFEKLNDFDKSSVGGKLPDDKIFMEK